MKFEKTGKKVNKDTARNSYKYDVNQNNTFTTISYLALKHKVGLLAFWAITMTVLYMFPAAPSELLSLIRG